MLELLAQPSLTVLPTTLSGTEVELSIFGLTVLIAAIMPWLARTFSKINSAADTSNSGEANNASRRSFVFKLGAFVTGILILPIVSVNKASATGSCATGYQQACHCQIGSGYVDNGQCANWCPPPPVCPPGQHCNAPVYYIMTLVCCAPDINAGTPCGQYTQLLFEQQCY